VITIGKWKLHYAWVVLFAACMLNIASRADHGSFGVFVEPLVELFGWSRGDISAAYSIAFIVGLPAVVIMGWLGDRYGARWLMIGAALLITLGTYLIGTITELWQFYVFYGFFVGSMGHAAFTVLLPVILTRWFDRHMGVAVGIYWAAMGIGPMVFAPLFQWLIETRGWGPAFTLIAIVVGVILLGFSLLIRSSPREMGLAPYGAEVSPPEPRAHKPAGIVPAGLREVMSQRPVWLLIAIHFLGCAGHSVILAHIVSMAITQGISGMEAAAALSIISGASAVSRSRSCSSLRDPGRSTRSPSSSGCAMAAKWWASRSSTARCSAQRRRSARSIPWRWWAPASAWPWAAGSAAFSSTCRAPIHGRSPRRSSPPALASRWRLPCRRTNGRPRPARKPWQLRPRPGESDD
jgi:MFS family permease